MRLPAKIIFFFFFLCSMHYALCATPAFSNNADAYKGGLGSGGDMAEYTGRLDQSGALPQAVQAYTGGPVSGSDVAEYAGPLKAGSAGCPVSQCGKSKPASGWLKRLFSRQ